MVLDRALIVQIKDLKALVLVVGRLRQALAAYDEALALRRDVPLAYAETQNNRAVLLMDLATLPGEDRGGRLRQALADIESAMTIIQHVQQAQ